jgi:Adenylate kinase
MVLQSADGGRHHSAPMLFGLRAVMLGRQGSGKGTQGLQLARLLVVPHISVGDALREAARSASQAGRRAQETMERGELVDDDLVVSLVTERLAAADVRSGGFVLDGFPRTVEQAEALARMLTDGMLSSITNGTCCSWTGGCSRRPSTRPTTASFLTRWPKTAIRWTPPAQRDTPLLRRLQGPRARQIHVDDGFRGPGGRTGRDRRLPGAPSAPAADRCGREPGATARTGPGGGQITDGRCR